MLSINRSKGQASLVMILLIGFVAITSAIASSSLSVSNVLIEDTVHISDQAWYAAWAGVDEIAYRLRSKQSFAPNAQISLTLDGGATVSAIVQTVGSQATIRSTGFMSGIQKNLEVVLASSSSKTSFMYAVQAGVGGIDLEGQTVVRGSNNQSGNIYSNGAVRGKSTSSGNSGSRVLGSVWAVDYVGGLDSPSSGGVYVQKNAWANSLSACRIGGDATAPQPPTNCPYSGTFTISTAPPAVSLASVDAQYWKNTAQAGGIWNGNCTVGSGNSLDCTGGTKIIGNKKIDGNMIIPSGTNLTVTGPLWITGNITIDSNNSIITSESVGKDFVVMVVSSPTDNLNFGRISTSSNVTFVRNSQGSGLVVISENTSMNCSSPSVKTSSNTATVVYIALSGCVYVNSNSVLSGIIANKIFVENNSIIQFDPNLAKAIVEPNSGGWAVISVKEF